jgi:hypothetical protein
MVAPPLGKPLALLGTDPRRLRALMDRGLRAYERAANEVQQIEGIRLVQLSAVLGYGPARDLLAREYSRSRRVRSAVSAPDAIRYALDAFTSDPSAAKSSTASFNAMAVYHADQKALGLLATNMIETIGDDRRLQAAKRLDLMLDALAPVSGACAAVARAATVQDCSPALRQAVLVFVGAATPVGRDQAARRQALALMERLDGSR